LRESNIVKQDFPVSNSESVNVDEANGIVTMPPPSFPRGGTLMKNVHVALPDLTLPQATHAIESLQKQPLFPDTSARSQSITLMSDVGLRADIPAYPTRYTAHQWLQGQIGSLTESSSGPEYRKDVARVESVKPTVEWSMDNRTRGRRVLIRGLPGLLPEYRLRRVGEDCGVEPDVKGMTDREDVKRLPAYVPVYEHV
jgi:hypothetical protein